jgi:hypothetical protein
MSTAQRVTFHELTTDPNLPTLAARYAEHATAELRGSPFDLAYYARLDEVPGCSAWVVRDGRGVLTGFAVLVIAARPHFNALAATVESIYAESRGLMLRRAIEQYAKEQGAAVLLMSAPYESRASAALAKTGMRVCSSIHIKAL